MITLCCYVKLHPRTAMALAVLAPGAELADVSGSPFAYWEQISRRWAGTEDLVLIEQDIEIHAGVLPGFGKCQRPWCVYPYQIHDKGTLIDFGLGCTRFRATVQAQVSTRDIQAYPGECRECNGAPGCWRHLDCKIAWAMNAAAVTQCVHWPGVEHHSSQVQDASPARRMRWHRIDPDLRDEARN